MNKNGIVWTLELLFSNLCVRYVSYESCEFFSIHLFVTSNALKRLVLSKSNLSPSKLYIRFQ